MPALLGQHFSRGQGTIKERGWGWEDRKPIQSQIHSDRGPKFMIKQKHVRHMVQIFLTVQLCGHWA